MTDSFAIVTGSFFTNAALAVAYLVYFGFNSFEPVSFKKILYIDSCPPEEPDWTVLCAWDYEAWQWKDCGPEYAEYQEKRVDCDRRKSNDDHNAPWDDYDTTTFHFEIGLACFHTVVAMLKVHWKNMNSFTTYLDPILVLIQVGLVLQLFERRYFFNPTEWTEVNTH